MFEKLARFFRRQKSDDIAQFKILFEKFQQILAGNNRTLELISEFDDKLGGEYVFDINYLKHVVESLSEETYLVISNLNVMSENRYPGLFSRHAAIREELNQIVEGHPLPASDKYVLGLADIDSDLTEITGGKSAHLGEIKNHLKMLVPEGFVVTTAAYRKFMAFNKLWPEIHELNVQFGGSDKKSVGQFDRLVAALFDKAKIPPDLEKAINRKIGELQRRRDDRLGLAVRSSAYGEDVAGRSYAGQFKSLLNCRNEEVLPAYKKVLASRFRRAVTLYGGRKEIPEEELPMAVSVQRMVPATSAGVAYSISPTDPRIDRLVIASTFGLGTAVVGGTAPADHFWVSRTDPSRVIERRVGDKKTMIMPIAPEGLKTVNLPEEKRKQASLTDDQVIRLAERILLLERYFKRPVDVEWCFDDRGELYILQCRAFKLPSRAKNHPANLGEILARRKIIMHNKGQVTQRGIVAGKVWQVKEDDDPETFPVGAIAVTKYTTPRLTSIIRRCAAIITDVGSPTGHMATISREFGVPMIVNTADATSLLPTGEEITVDAEENIIYKGIIAELLEYEMDSEDVFRDLKEYHILRRLLRKISPLYMVDPYSSEFVARNCRTYHDIVRFCHEKAVQLLINLNISSRRFRGVKSRRLELPVPLGLLVIDLGGGVASSAEGDTIPHEAIRSVPMRAFIKGLTSPGVWSTQPMQLGFSDLVSSLTRYSMTDRVAEYQGQNLAVISDCYANLSLRLGYHFNVIDTYVSENINDNYIYFRFVGGVTETERRHRRAVLLKEILEKLNFKVMVSGDLVVARLKKCEASEMVHNLEEIGRLVGFSRQLDTQMLSEESVRQSYEAFFREGGELNEGT
jgi:pyruvate,water dikinase